MVGTSAFLVWVTCFKKPNTLLAEGEINVADEKTLLSTCFSFSAADHIHPIFP
jgi:hypothetical protein